MSLQPLKALLRIMPILRSLPLAGNVQVNNVSLVILHGCCQVCWTRKKGFKRVRSSNKHGGVRKGAFAFDMQMSNHHTLSQSTDGAMEAAGYRDCSENRRCSSPGLPGRSTVEFTRCTGQGHELDSGLLLGPLQEDNHDSGWLV